MSDDKHVETEIFASTDGRLSRNQLAELKEKFGLELRVRSSSASVDKMISRIDLASSYDRTHPGYGRNYDKDPDLASSLISELVRPIGKIDLGHNR